MSPLERPRLCAGKSNGEKGPFLSGDSLFALLDVVAMWRVGCSVASPVLRKRSSRRKMRAFPEYDHWNISRRFRQCAGDGFKARGVESDRMPGRRTVPYSKNSGTKTVSQTDRCRPKMEPPLRKATNGIIGVP
jgi:hypothetical protein